MPIFRKSISGLVLTAALAVLAGCERKEARVYLVPKEPPAKEDTEDTAATGPASDPHANPHASTDAGREGRPTLSGVLPAGWKDLGGDQMNAAKFQAGESTVSATPLASFAGKEQLAVNLWRDAMGQPHLDDAAALAMLKEIPVGDAKGKIFDLTGERTDEHGQKYPTRIVTVLLNREGLTWFFKLQGPPSSVEQQIGPFKEFLSTVGFEEPKPVETPKAPVLGSGTPPPTAGKPTPAAPPPPPPKVNTAETPGAPLTSNPPASPAATTSPAVPAQPPAPGKALAIPADWTVLTPGPMQAAKFSVPEKDGAKAEVSVSIFPSDTGGTLANVRRWRGQMGLPEADDATVQASAKPLEGGPAGAIFVELANNGQGFLGAIVPRGGEWYFYKLVGGAPAVAAARESFIVFARAQ